jgi:hypothetical protein
MLSGIFQRSGKMKEKPCYVSKNRAASKVPQYYAGSQLSFSRALDLWTEN